jgi:hypothetical protein
MDINGNYDAGRAIIGVPPVSNSSRAVPVYHLGQSPQGFLSAPLQAVCIGTNGQAGNVWVKNTTSPGANSWTQVLP